MSHDLREFPTTKIPYLYGDEQVPVFNMTDAAHREIVESGSECNPDEKRLYSWLTIPMAAEMVGILMVDPLSEQGIDEGLNIARNDFHDVDFAASVSRVRKKMRGGSVLPTFVHLIDDPAASNPEEEARLTVLVPTSQDRRIHNIFDLVGKYKTLSSRGVNKDNPQFCVSVLTEFTATQNKAAATAKLLIPEEPSLGETAESDRLPVLRNHSKWLGAQHGIRGIGLQ
ncbi:MAG: hypothetical protein QG628_225 [Patescibacteria group bacterium]|nr:hypothetical protein [Patescibacteria group bacterium]